MRELYEADFHKPWIYGRGRLWANAWNVFHRPPSRVGCGRQAAVNFVVWFGWGIFFFRAYREFAFSNSLVDPVSEQPAWTGEEDSTASQSAHRELAPTNPRQVYRLVCSLLRKLASAVDQYSSSRPASLDLTSACNRNKFFSSFKRERQPHLLATRKTPVHTQEGRRDTCSDTTPAGRCVGAVWVACWACQRYRHQCLSQ